jgi:hypothetical protein
MLFLFAHGAIVGGLCNSVKACTATHSVRVLTQNMHPLCGPTTSNRNNKLRMHRYTKAHRVRGSWCAGMIGHDQSASALAQLHNLILEYHMGPILPSRTLHRRHVCIGLMHPHHDAYKYAGSPVWPWTSRHRSSTFPESIRSNGTKG